MSDENKQKKIKIILKNGTFYDLNMPADFNFGTFVGQIRINGYFMRPDIYVPADWIGTIFIFEEGGEAVLKSGYSAAGNRLQ
jgi:hypothetical protein